jgi:hypothetical protein
MGKGKDEDGNHFAGAVEEVFGGGDPRDPAV